MHLPPIKSLADKIQSTTNKCNYANKVYEDFVYIVPRYCHFAALYCALRQVNQAFKNILTTLMETYSAMMLYLGVTTNHYHTYCIDWWYIEIHVILMNIIYIQDMACTCLPLAL